MTMSLYDINGPGLYIDDGAIGNLSFSQQKDCTTYLNQARYSLNVIRSRPLGLSLLKAVRAACTNGKIVVIERPDDNPQMGRSAAAIPVLDTSETYRARLRERGGASLVVRNYPLVVRGQSGTSVVIRWEFNDAIPMTNPPIKRPAFIALIHELIHALHFLTADCPRSPGPVLNWKVDGGLQEEEARTIGIGPYDYPSKSLAFCENAFRATFNLAKRTEYSTGIDLKSVVRTT